jgi:hypothetical protein
VKVYPTSSGLQANQLVESQHEAELEEALQEYLLPHHHPHHLSQPAQGVLRSLKVKKYRYQQEQ